MHIQMKKLGYIHRYKQSEGYGILVYGNGYFGEWNYIPPILFDHRQCKSLIKTGQLVYFEIEDDGSIKNIEPASIYNFDRDIVLSYVSVCDSKDWHECERSTHIRYQNIAELSEWVSEGTDISISEIEDAKNDDNTVATPLDDDGILELLDDFDLIDDFLDEYDLEAHHSKGQYQRIKIPDSVVEEYKLFGRIFINEISSVATFWEDDIGIQKMQNISIDILDPALWIPAKLHGKKKYYGGNATEFNDLIDIIFIRRRNALGRNLDSLRYKESDEFWKLNINFQKQLHPELFLNDCISNRWQLLLERLSEEDLKEAYQHCKLLQPILPKTFCHQYIAFLDEDYGFPDVSIAEEFLKYKVHNIHNATEYKHYMDLLHAAKNCGVEHLPEEGVPFCAIGKTKLKNITISLGRKKRIFYRSLRTKSELIIPIWN